MTKEEQRREIAKFCGWYENHDPSVESGLDGSRPWSKKIGDIILISYGPDYEYPDYPNDLNAMHEAEIEIMAHGLWTEYNESLCVICDGLEWSGPCTTHATAAQKASALIETLRRSAYFDELDKIKRINHILDV